MSGTDDARLAGVIRALTVTGALALAGWASFVFWAVSRATRVSASRIAGVWEERIETMSFLVLPPNVPVLALAAAAAAAATWLAGPTQELGLAVLLRLTRWSANGLVLLGVVSVVTQIVTDAEGPDRLGSLATRLGGTLMAAALSYLCLAAGRNAPGG